MKPLVLILASTLLYTQLYAVEPEKGFFEQRIEKIENLCALVGTSTIQTMHRHAYLTAFIASLVQVYPLGWHRRFNVPLGYIIIGTLIQGALLKTFTRAIMKNYQIPTIK